MKMLRSLAYALLIVAVGIIIGFIQERKSHAAGPLAIYGCAEQALSSNTSVVACRVYDPETGKHFIVSTVYSLHGDGIAMTSEGWQ